MGDMMDCPKCKRELIDGCEFCPICGWDLSKPYSPTAEEVLGISPEKSVELVQELCPDGTNPMDTGKIISSILESDWTEKEKIAAAYGYGMVIGNPMVQTLGEMLGGLLDDIDPEDFM